MLEVNGVGYKIFVSPEIKSSLKSDTTLFCYHQRTEKEDRIYGFQKEKSLELFERLLRISGIGPKTALQIASHTSLEELKEGIEKEDERILQKIFSIGEKKGQQVVFEISRKHIKKSCSEERDEALEALKELGFKEKEANEALEGVSKKKNKEKRVEEALKKLGNHNNEN